MYVPVGRLWEALPSILELLCFSSRHGLDLKPNRQKIEHELFDMFYQKFDHNSFLDRMAGGKYHLS